MVEKPGGKADRRIRNAVQGLRSRPHQPGVVDLLEGSDELLVGALFVS
jgi:hypothetical protein